MSLTQETSRSAKLLLYSRHIKSEAFVAEELHREGLLDIMISQQILADLDDESSTVKGCIQHISVLPFTVIMYSEPQLRLLVKLLKEGRVNLHVDATGNVCAKMKTLPSSKRMMYYAAVVASSK